MQVDDVDASPYSVSSSSSPSSSFLLRLLHQPMIHDNGNDDDDDDHILGYFLFYESNARGTIAAS